MCFFGWGAGIEGELALAGDSPQPQFGVGGMWSCVWMMAG